MNIITYEKFLALLRDNQIYADEDCGKYQSAYAAYVFSGDLQSVINHIKEEKVLDKGLTPFKDFVAVTRLEINRFQKTNPFDSTSYSFNTIKKMFEEHPVETEIDVEAGNIIVEMADKFNWVDKQHMTNYNIICNILADIEKSLKVLVEVKSPDWRRLAVKNLEDVRDNITSLVKDDLNKGNNDWKRLSFYARKLEAINDLIDSIKTESDKIK